MKTTIEFRKCTPNDLSLLAEMIREMSVSLKMQDLVQSVGEKFESQLKDHLFGESPKAEIRILEVDGYPAGYCAFYQTFSTFRAAPGLHLEDIYVREPFHKTGAGRHMMQAICKIAQKRHCVRVEWVAPSTDERINRFYDSLEVPTVSGWKVYRARNTIAELAAQAPFDDEQID